MLFLLPDDFFDLMDNVEERLLGCPKDKLPLGVIPIRLDVMRVGVQCLLGPSGVCHFVPFIFQ